MSVRELMFKHPFTCLVAGSTGSGKTVWVRNLLKEYKYLIDIKVKVLKVLWCYGQDQDLHKVLLKNVDLIYLKRLPTSGDIENIKPNIIVLDDLMNELKNDEIIKNLFTQGSHHCNLSILFITQNLFYQDKSMRTISLNAQYIVILKGIRLTQQIQILGNQIYPGKSKLFLNIYKDATKDSFSYLILDLHPNSDDKYRLRNRIFKSELPKLLSTKYNSAPIFYSIEE